MDKKTVASMAIIKKLGIVISVLGLIILVLSSVFLVTTALSDILDYKKGLYTQGLQDEADLER